jgi:TRAP-type C4-dicarboxylate transport system permease large subunit
MMVTVIIPIVLLLVIILVPAIPKIGGEVRIGLLVAGVSAAFLGGLGAADTVSAAISGIDKLAWVIMLSIFGSLYAESQVKLGTMDTVLNTFRSLFGNSSKGLIASIIFTLVLAGSLLGDAIAAATVIGFLVVSSLRDLRLNGEQISLIILMGAVIGSVMPPISQAIFLSSSLIGINPEPVLKVGYVTVGLGVVVAVITGVRLVNMKKIPEALLPKQTFKQILSSHWYTLVPLALLVVIVVASSGFGFNIFERWTPFVRLSRLLNQYPIIQGITFPVVLAIIVALAVSFLFPRVRREAVPIFIGGLRKVNKTVQIQLCAGIMIGIFYEAGLIEMVKAFAESLEPTAMKWGGGFATILVGMLTGSQTTAQTVIVTFLGPVLMNLGVEPVNTALGAAHLAMAGQSMPPVGLTTFVIVGIVGGIMNEKVDPVKVMILALPLTVYFAISGFIAWFI